MRMPGGPSNTERNSEVLVFHEDRSDVARRAMPRLAVGTAGWCLLAVVVVIAQGGPVSIALAVAGLVWVVAMGTRFDVLALQFGRPIRYELHPDRFLAYRGPKLVTSFQFYDVRDWGAASSASTWGYWVGWGYWRSAFMPTLDQYEFTLSACGGGRGKTVAPPALFRWEDRGGLEDVTHALIERLGPPVNYSINYSADGRRTSSTARGDD